MLPHSGPLVAPSEVDQPVDDVDVDPDRPWVVIVWNDPINLMSYVTYVLQKLFGYPLEVAELDVFRLHEHGLWATMQQD